MAKITQKQKVFGDEYLKDLNATQAAIRAGYSSKSASRIAVELLNKPQVAEYIQKRRRDREQRTEITQDRVLQELASIGFSKGTDYAEIAENGAVILTPTNKLSERQKAAITAIKETQHGIEIKLADKVKALELLGKHLGMFENNGSGMNAEDRLKEYLMKLEECAKNGF